MNPEIDKDILESYKITKDSMYRIEKIMGGGSRHITKEKEEVIETGKKKTDFEAVEEMIENVKDMEEEEEIVEDVRDNNPIKESIKEMILDGDIQLAWAESDGWRNDDKKIVLAVKQYKTDGSYEMKQQDRWDGLELDIRVGY